MSLKGIVKGTVSRVAKKLDMLDIEIVTLGDARMSVCKSCPLFSKGDSKCTECGCYMKTKVLHRESKCPLNKW